MFCSEAQIVYLLLQHMQQIMLKAIKCCSFLQFYITRLTDFL